MSRLNWHAFTNLTVAHGSRWAVFVVLGGGLALGGILGAIVAIASTPGGESVSLVVLLVAVTVAICGVAVLGLGM